MAAKKPDSKGSISVCRLNTDALKKVNQQILKLLDRLPLEKQSDVVALNRLMADQERLIRVTFGGKIPCRIEVFNDNERYRACILKQRFADAYRNDKIKKAKETPHDTTQNTIGS